MSAYRTAAATKSLPARCAAHFDELPRASQDHLRDVSARESSATKRERHTRVYTILSVAAGFFVLVAAAIWSQAAKEDYEKLGIHRHTPWDAGEITTITGACFVVGVLLLGGMAALLRQRNAPLGVFWYVHKAYLFDCAHDRVVAYPLALLTDGEVVGESVQLSFGEIDLQIAFDFPQDAVAFLVPLRQHATAAAGYLARGAIDEIPGADFIPDALLYRATPRLPWDRAWALPLFAGAALALVGRLVLPGLHASVAEGRMVRACQEMPKICPEYPAVFPGGARLDDVDDAYFVWTSSLKLYSQYQTAFPAGRHVRDATVLAIDAGAEALERYRKGQVEAKRQGDPALVGAIASTLRALSYARTTAVTLQVTGTIDDDLSHSRRSPDLHRTNAQAISDPEIYGLPPLAGVTARKELRAAVLAAVGPGAIDLREPARDDPNEDAVTLALTYRIFKGPRAFQSATGTKGPYQEIDIDWTLSFSWPASARIADVSVTIHTVPSPTFRSYGSDSELVYMNMMDDDAANLGRALRQALGLPVE
ncbi:MAG: hypothetical protein ABJE95_06610 [Byssovorax sp.]